MVTDDVPPPRRDPLPRASQQAAEEGSSGRAKSTPPAAPERPPQQGRASPADIAEKAPASPPVVAPKEAASPPVVARSPAVAAGPLRLTLKFPPSPNAASATPPQSDRPVVAIARLVPKAADPNADADRPPLESDGEEGVAFASDSEEKPRQSLQLTIKHPPRDAKAGSSATQAPNAGTP